jgi:hypothetical protein
MAFEEKDIKLAELQFRLKAMADDITKLQAEKETLMGIIRANGLEEELGSTKILSDEEFICVNEIRKLKSISEIRDLTNDETKIFDILFKTLRTIRTGKDPEPVKKQKMADVKELLKIVESADGN